MAQPVDCSSSALTSSQTNPNDEALVRAFNAMTGTPMTSRKKCLLAIGALLAFNASGAQPAMRADANALNGPPAADRQSETEGLRTFLAGVATADAIDDPIQRCLAYPDPPGSHWSHDAVAAYCHYRIEPVMSVDDMDDLIRHGKASELDQRLADALRAQLTHSGTPELLDRIYNRNFWTSTPELRQQVEAWKHQSPRSAFAHAASGMLYVDEAQTARGGAYASDTPKSNIVAMKKLLKSAKGDLHKAIKLDPRMLPAYASMIRVGGLGSDNGYAHDAANRALAIDPSSFTIYSQLSWLAQPKWGGTLDAMRKVAEQAQGQANNNPLLVLLLPEAEAAQAGLDVCGCGTIEQLSAYNTVFDHAAMSDTLIAAANAAADNQTDPQHSLPLALIYLSEASRFNPDNRDLRIRRINFLAEMGQQQLARAEADRLVASFPTDIRALNARAVLEVRTNDYPGAERDFKASLQITPDNRILAQLGHVYADATREWDKGWDISDYLIRTSPKDPEGWILRAHIQKNQPRTGLRDTIDYFLAHFSSVPAQADDVAEMREWLSQDPRPK
jgi:tetratricopeptide (TPR) repeat protein